MTDDDTIIRRAYAEAALSAKDKGLSGHRALVAVLSAAAKVSTRILGRDISPQDVERTMRASY